MGTEEQQASDVESQDEGQDIGVLGWAGFAIINWACWGIIGLSTSSSWLIGVVICVIYIGITIGIASYLETSVRYRKFVNLFWVLACSFTFVAGTMLSLYITSFNETNRMAESLISRTSSADIQDFLPDNSSDALKEWANDNDWSDKQKPTYALFDDKTYFSTINESSRDVLAVSDGADVHIFPSLRQPTNLLVVKSVLYFLGERTSFVASGKSGKDLWKVDKHSPKEAIPVTELGIRTEHLFFDDASGRLWFKGNYYCGDGGQWVHTIFHSDGTADGTVDLRHGECPETPPSPPTPPSPADVQNLGWYLLFLAVLPMLALAAWALRKKKVPGVFANLWIGGIAAFIVLYMEILGPNNNFFNVFKWYLTVYSSVGYIALAVASVRYSQVPMWIEELKTWAVVVVSITFYIAVHLVLEVPFTSLIWPWWAYFVVILVQMLLSMLVARTLPMIFGAVGLLACSVRLAWGIVNTLGLEGVTAGLVMLAMVALMGLGIIGGALFYKDNEVKINGRIQASAERCFGGGAGTAASDDEDE